MGTVKLLIISILAITLGSCNSDENINASTDTALLLSKKGAEYIMSNQHNSTLGKAIGTLKLSINDINPENIIVPPSLDAGGGYSHEKHKSNYLYAKNAGTLYTLTGEHKYFEIARQILLGYAKVYPSLPLHPQQKNQGPGKLFWQILNEEVALVHFVQAYDAIKNNLSNEDDLRIQNELLIPMVSFLKDDSERTFKKIHNHAMWGVAAVGMTALTLDNESWLNAALYGPEGDTTSGYFAIIDALFSPDGYYSEGPYYQRYALMPLVLFAQALEQNRPDIDVFSFKDSVILKSIETTFELSTCNGFFFPINDAIKSKTVQTPELGYALPLMYAYGGGNPKWLSAIASNGNCMLTDALIGIKSTGETYVRDSRFISDGPKGKVGGLGILRTDEECNGLTTVLKFGTHGMGHGHFDQLGVQLFVKGSPFISDYGASRFLNVPQKFGGRYLPENNTWANQTIAHNTLVIDGKSQYDGEDKSADRGSSHLLYSYFTDSVNAVAGIDSSAYKGTVTQRHNITLIVEDDPVYIDFLHVTSTTDHTYELPYYFEGQLIESSPVIAYNTQTLVPLGDKNGYQHLWDLGRSEQTKNTHHTWQKDDGFITLQSVAMNSFNSIRVATGSHDPENNLTAAQGIIARSVDMNEQAWFSVFQSHGSYDPIHEKTDKAYSNLTDLTLLRKNDGGFVLSFESDKYGYEFVLPSIYDQQALPSIIYKTKENE